MVGRAQQNRLKAHAGDDFRQRTRELEREVESLKDELAEANELCGALRFAAESAFLTTTRESEDAGNGNLGPQPLQSRGGVSSECATCAKRRKARRTACSSASGKKSARPRKLSVDSRCRPSPKTGEGEGGLKEPLVPDASVGAMDGLPRADTTNASEGGGMAVADASGSDTVDSLSAEITALREELRLEKEQREQVEWAVNDLRAQRAYERALELGPVLRELENKTSNDSSTTVPESPARRRRKHAAPPIPYSPGLRLATLRDVRSVHQRVMTRLIL